jgi:cytochrome c
MKPFFAFFVGLLICDAVAASLEAQSGRLASSGVYTAQQAEQGAALYESKCASCHNEDLSGGDTAPAVAGPDFYAKWGGLPLAALFNSIHKTMPSDHPGTLTGEQTAEVMAFLLRSNRLAAGKAELPSDADALQQILMDKTPPDAGN